MPKIYFLYNRWGCCNSSSYLEQIYISQTFDVLDAQKFLENYEKKSLYVRLKEIRSSGWQPDITYCNESLEKYSYDFDFIIESAKKIILFNK